MTRPSWTRWPFARRATPPRLSHSERCLEIATIAVDMREHVRKNVDRQVLIQKLAQAGASAPNDAAAIDAMEIVLMEAENPLVYWDGSERGPG